MAKKKEVTEVVTTLQSHHVNWLLEQAHKHWAEQVQDMEQEIIRHSHFKDQPLIEGMIAERESRAERVEKCFRWLEGYTSLCNTLQLFRRAAVDLTHVGHGDTLEIVIRVPKQKAKK